MPRGQPGSVAGWMAVHPSPSIIPSSPKVISDNTNADLQQTEVRDVESLDITPEEEQSPRSGDNHHKTQHLVKYQYFLSHKKHHSVHGGVPGQIARNIHDNLTLMGYSGWFDVDNLELINEEELRVSIAECGSIIILFNDETCDSEWCRFEWRIAAELHLPFKVVVSAVIRTERGWDESLICLSLPVRRQIDMERCSKKFALETLRNHAPASVLAHQLSELTERHRRDCLVELGSFLDRVKTTKDRPSQKRKLFMDESRGSISFGDDSRSTISFLAADSTFFSDDGDDGGESTAPTSNRDQKEGQRTQPLFHRHFAAVLLLAGSPTTTPRKKAGRVWMRVVPAIILLVFVAASLNAVVDLIGDGSAFYNAPFPALVFGAFLATHFDRCVVSLRISLISVARFAVFQPLVVSFRSVRLSQIYKSRAILEIIRTLSGGTSTEIRDRLYGRSKKHARYLALFAILGYLFIVIPTMSLMWHPYYFSHDASGIERFSAIISGFAVMIGAPIVILIQVRPCSGETFGSLRSLSSVSPIFSRSSPYPKRAFS